MRQAEAIAETMKGAGPTTGSAPPAEAQGLVDQIQQAFPGASVNVGPGASAGPREDQVAQLERLARLRDSGGLSDEEFSAAKRRILDGD